MDSYGIKKIQTCQTESSPLLSLSSLLQNQPNVAFASNIDHHLDFYVSQFLETPEIICQLSSALLLKKETAPLGG